MLLWSLTSLLAWNSRLSSAFDSKAHLASQKLYLKDFYLGVVGVIMLLCPALGWIADTYWGRYKMVRQSLFIMWLTTIGLNLVSVIPEYLPHATVIKEVSHNLFFVCLFVSLGALQVNIVQFGIDQLPGASSSDIVSFSNWYVWAWYLCSVIVTFSQQCVCPKYTAVAELLLPTCLTLALCLDYNFNHWLIKEPVSENSLKLIYRVMHYAWKNKYPRQRSAFTYSDDKRYSRIDFAKLKFGGPFTVEQVEDVKTFWQILLFFIITSLCIGFSINLQSVAVYMRYHLRDLSFKKVSLTSANDCYQRESVYGIGNMIVILVIPLYELVLHQVIARPSIFTNLNIGLFLAFISMIGFLCIEVTGHTKVELDGNETNITCLLEVEASLYSVTNSLPLDYKWIAFPECFRILSTFFMLSAVIQFVSAQSPYSMKGLVFGLAYGFFGLSFLVTYVIMLPITYTVHKWPANRYGCGTWYLLAASIVLLLMFISACILSWRYKKRQRGDTLPNEHIFAIDYYSRYTMHNTAEA